MDTNPTMLQFMFSVLTLTRRTSRCCKSKVYCEGSTEHWTVQIKHKLNKVTFYRYYNCEEILAD